MTDVIGAGVVERVSGSADGFECVSGVSVAGEDAGFPAGAPVGVRWCDGRPWSSTHTTITTPPMPAKPVVMGVFG
ncbi:hypothetical protein ABZ348_29150 [Streptomyces sp. NPDC005963]|uniref:hypothetical protein n=1 Tax=Streptomyces sp. NPDC005963 TaxID=3156721 RepID=UPI00340A4E5B